MYRYFRLVIIPLLFLSSGVLLAFSVFFINTAYLDFTNSIIAIYHLEDKASVIKTQYLTKSTYETIKYIFITISLIVPLLSFYIFLHLEIIYLASKQFLAFLQGLYKKLKLEINTLTKTELNTLVVTFIILTIIRIYFSFAYPIHIDEAFSYVFIVSKGWLATVSYYPGPNNHVAYLLLCAPINAIIDNPEITMRLPVVIISSITTVLLFLVIKKYMGFIFSYATVVFFSFSEYGMFYAVHGRGYFMVLLLFIVAIISLIRSINLGSRYYFILFCVASSIGFYTIPIFIYPLASLLVGGLVYVHTSKNTRKLRWLFISGLLIFSMTTIMYFPIIITNGYTALLGNEWVKPLEAPYFYQNILFYLADTPGTFYSLDIYGIWITVFNLSFWLWIALKPHHFESVEKHINLKQIAIFILSFYLVPLAMVFVQQVMPGTRTWLYLSLIEYTSLLFAIKIIIKKWRQDSFIKTDNQVNQVKLVNRSLFGLFSSRQSLSLTWVCLAIYSTFMVLYLNNYTLYKEKVYASHPTVINDILEHNAKKVLVTEDIYNVFLRYEAIKRNQDILVDTEYSNQRLFYDFLVLKNKDEFPPHLNDKVYQKTYFDDFVSVYERVH